MAYLIYLVPVVVILISIRKYRESKWGKCKNNIKLNNKIAIVTGANSGIGYEIAKELATRNAEVILACRNIANATEAAAKIQKELAKPATLVPMLLDLSSLKSVYDFVKNIKQKYPKIHILINNAGVSFPKSKRECTQDGYEIHFGVNHLGHFYLTNLLLENLAKPSRIIVVASSLHERGVIDVNDLNAEKAIDPGNLYANSKLANVYFARELAKRTKDEGISVYAVCPGWVYTNLFRHSIRWYHYFMVLPVAFFFMRGPKSGSQTPIFCATEPNLEQETGRLFRDCKLYRSSKNFDDETAEKLWEESEKMVARVMK